MSVDYAHAELLMQVIKLSADLGPAHANSIASLAIAELKDIENTARKELLILAKKAHEEELIKKAQAEAEAKAAEEAAAEASAAADEDARKPTPTASRRPL